MPIIYLSPSTQEWNYYVNGGTEEEYMNLLADKMVPYLDASGIRYDRNTPSMTAADSIAASNAGNFDLHLALHSNAAPEGQYGTSRGSIAFYYPGSIQGKWAADIIANNLRSIYPLPDKVRAVSTTTLGEVRKVRPLPSSWSWPSTTTRTTPPGSKTTWMRSPATWSSRSLSSSDCPS